MLISSVLELQTRHLLSGQLVPERACSHTAGDSRITRVCGNTHTFISLNDWTSFDLHFWGNLAWEKVKRAVEGEREREERS